MHVRNCLKFNMLMYPDYLFNCLHFGHGLLIFIILMVFWLSETRIICSYQVFSWECIGGIGWTYLVISDEMEQAIFILRKLSSFRAGGILLLQLIRSCQENHTITVILRDTSILTIGLVSFSPIRSQNHTITERIGLCCLFSQLKQKQIHSSAWIVLTEP